MAKKKKEKEFPLRTYPEFLNWSQSLMLMRFVEEGGEGIRSALTIILSMYKQNFVKKS